MRDLVMVGAEHRSAPIELRERLALPPPRVGAVLADLMAIPPVLEALVLSTCGRTELYVVADDADAAESHLLGVLDGATRVERGRAVVHHLHRVAAGLES